jgi:hypothetical protein
MHLPQGCLQGGTPEEGLEGGGAERRESERPERRILPAPAAHTLYPSNNLESQLPHKIVNFLLWSVIVISKLTILWDSWLSKTM